MKTPPDPYQVATNPSKTASHALGQVFKEQGALVSENPEMRGAFNKTLGQLAPYSGTIEPNVEELSLGRAQVSMLDRPEIRNHLNSIHAVALMNLAELTTGLTVLFSCPENHRSIIVGLNIRYLKKARGTITAECGWDPPVEVSKSECVLDVTLCDQAGDTVAEAQSIWLIRSAIQATP